VARCRFLVKNPSFIPSDTEIRFISLGGEEAGCRGSRCYVKRYPDDLKRLDSRLLNIETVANAEIVILTPDVNGPVKNSPEIVKSVVATTESAGVPFKLSPATLGTINDSGPFNKVDRKAATLLAFKPVQQPETIFHQKRDNPDIFKMEPIFNILGLTPEWIKDVNNNIATA
jgi:hypothetical protein